VAVTGHVLAEWGLARVEKLSHWLVALACVLIAALSWMLTRPSTETVVLPATTEAMATVTPSPTPTPSQEGVPDGLLGDWKGVASALGGSYELILKVEQGDEGSRIGRFEIPGRCTFDLYLDEAQPDAIEVTDKPKAGSKCIGASGRLVLRGKSIRYSAKTRDGSVVTATLSRT
jgi:hypothetical protein